MDGNRIALHRAGSKEGLPVVLLHGAGQTRHSWRRVAERLAGAGYALLLADLRGHGDSDPASDGVYSYDRLCGDLERVIQAAGGRAALIGGSLGGKIGLASAPMLGDKLIGLAMIDAVPRSAERGIARVAGLLLDAESFASPEEAAKHLAKYRDAPVTSGAIARVTRNLRQRADGRWVWHYDTRFFLPEQNLAVARSLALLEAAARQVSVPALLIRGGRSDVVDDGGARALADLIPHLKVIVVEDAGHLVASEKPDACADALLPFLDGLRVKVSGNR